MATKIVYVYDKDTKEYKYPREIDVESSIGNSTEIPVPEVMYGKTVFTGNGWVTQTKEEWLASLPKAEVKPSPVVEAMNALGQQLVQAKAESNKTSKSLEQKVAGLTQSVNMLGQMILKTQATTQGGIK